MKWGLLWFRRWPVVTSSSVLRGHRLGPSGGAFSDTTLHFLTTNLIPKTFHRRYANIVETVRAMKHLALIMKKV
ncbi:hypothetical protein ALC60_05165 [Trachymyrmex zeteki]|uniref:Secreted protein n=1 Tax=Mycetomoellerius zeteki TaxID=64791 RepID=A0A151X653_9HYME|nr:hypothetical protein ALC60_05165 [Trachymyrmex zeteki]